jgi:CRISPR-associated protein Csd1
MILQSLCGYYDKVLKADLRSTIPRFGYEDANVGGCIVLNADGSISNIVSYADGEQRSRKLIVPSKPKVTSGIKAAFLCNDAGYLLGMDEKRGEAKRSAATKLHHELLDDIDDHEAQAVLAFFDLDEIGYESDVPNGNLVFRLQGNNSFVHENPTIRVAWEDYCTRQSPESETGQCLITGDTAPIARLHGSLPGFGKDKPTFVSFNKDSFTSFGKQQGDNAPVSELAAFKYATAFSLLMNDLRHNFRLGKDKVLFWAETEATEEEDFFGDMVSGGGIDHSKSDRVKKILSSIFFGKNPEEPKELDPDVMFCLLGVSSNRTRVVMRFYYRNTFGHILKSYARHLYDIEIISDYHGDIVVTPLGILLETAIEHKYDRIPPILDSALLRSIFWDRPYPYTLYMSILNRIKAEARVNRTRAGFLKGYINRNDRCNGRKEMIEVGLNLDETNQGYLLGRMMAIYEKAQYDALGKVNATVVDKYLNSALATPRTVFPVMEGMFEKHVSKSEKYYPKKLMGEVMDKIPSTGYPQTLSAEDQGRFVIGYYHQRQEFYSKGEMEGQTMEGQTAETIETNGEEIENV